LRRGGDDYVKIGDGPNVAVQDDGETANHDVTHLFAFEYGEDIVVKLWCYLRHWIKAPIVLSLLYSTSHVARRVGIRYNHASLKACAGVYLSVRVCAVCVERRAARTAGAKTCFALTEKGRADGS